MDFRIENPLSEEDNVSELLEAEKDYMALEGYSKNEDNLTYRNEAMQTISNYVTRSNFLEPVVPFLAINYFDRFISRIPLPIIVDGEKNNLKLFISCCFSIALKMMKINTVPPSNFLMDQDLKFEAKEIREMEFKILGALKWRTRTISALCFLDFFIGCCFDLSDDEKKSIKHSAMQHIYQNQYDVRYTEFKPSVVAASALLYSYPSLQQSKISKFEQATDAICELAAIEPETLCNCLPDGSTAAAWLLYSYTLSKAILVETKEPETSSSPSTPHSYWPMDNITTIHEMEAGAYKRVKMLVPKEEDKHRESSEESPTTEDTARD